MSIYPQDERKNKTVLILSKWMFVAWDKISSDSIMYRWKKKFQFQDSKAIFTSFSFFKSPK